MILLKHGIKPLKLPRSQDKRAEDKNKITVGASQMFDMQNIPEKQSAKDEMSADKLEVKPDMPEEKDKSKI